MAYREHIQPILEGSNDTAQYFEFDLDASIEQIAHWLPAQGPIKDFIHHNTLHAVQHHPFHEGVAIAAKIFGARSYLPLEDYQAMYRQGRIKPGALNWAIAHSGYPKQRQETLRATLFEQDDTGHYPPVSLANHGIRNAWLTRLKVGLNALVHPILFRLLGNFLDQGISRWSFPKNGEHFWDCVLRLAQNSLLPLYPLNEPGVRELLSESPDHVIKTCLEKIVGDQRHYEQYLLEVLLAHPGWSGMVRVIEQSPKSLLARREISLKEMLAVELTLTSQFIPLLGFLLIFLSTKNEKRIARISFWCSHALGISIAALLILWGSTGFQSHEYEWFMLYESGEYHLPILFYLDRIGAVYLFCTWAIFSIIVKYCPTRLV